MCLIYDIGRCENRLDHSIASKELAERILAEYDFAEIDKEGNNYYH